MKILLIDDDSDLCSLIKLKLDTHDHKKYNTKFLYSGECAVEMAEEFKPDVFIIDLQLPEKDGYILSANIRSNELFNNTKLIAISTISDTFDHKFDYYLQKPLDFDRLFEILDEIKKMQD